ncbi:MAG TPA: tRNA pseudouridine(13) synthase TruD [Legionella sp.]|nr:tRNA pseudouridine(13) synthase TruD [Legionella sp.]
MIFDVNELAYAYGKPPSTAVFKAAPDDFMVDEVLGFALSGVGEHQFLRIEKKGLNTHELVLRLAQCLGKPVKHISYAGLKDRQALTTQWLSVHCPGETIPGIHALHGEGWRVVDSGRHLKKLKTGGLSGNRFQLVLHEVQNKDAVEMRLQRIQADGVPNYFGPQRFGHQGQNMVKAMGMLLHGQRVKDRFLRGIYYSAARSFLFNRILSARVEHETWDKALPGDVMQLTGTQSIFSIERPDEALHARVALHDVSPTSLLWGTGESRVSAEALIIQQQGLDGLDAWCDALEQHGLERAYRAHVLCADQLAWCWQAYDLMVSFELTAGSYATSVLRELVVVQ